MRQLQRLPRHVAQACFLRQPKCGLRQFQTSLQSLASSDRAKNPGEFASQFGFSSVDDQDKKGMVHDVFRSVADSYDVMNDLMSAGVHRLWKDEYVRMLGPTWNPDGTANYLDVAGGTGDISFRIADELARIRSSRAPSGQGRVIVCDINANMLRVGEQRAREAGRQVSEDSTYDGRTENPSAGKAGEQQQQQQKSSGSGSGIALRFVEGDAEQLPFEDGSFDAYTIAFGIRNVTRLDLALKEARRVLRPGGRFMCLEFSQVTNPVIAQAYDAYSFNVIPAVGQAVTGDREAYQYLVESIRKFPSQKDFADMMREAGLVDVSWTDFSLGVCAVHSGFRALGDKPSSSGGKRSTNVGTDDGSEGTESAAASDEADSSDGSGEG